VRVDVHSCLDVLGLLLAGWSPWPWQVQEESLMNRLSFRNSGDWFLFASCSKRYWLPLTDSIGGWL
jgi:hypothetical protein